MDEIEIVEQEIRNLTSVLESSVSDIGDWKVIKCYEASLKGERMPYNVDDLLYRRQIIRDKINYLQDELEHLRNKY